MPQTALPSTPSPQGAALVLLGGCRLRWLGLMAFGWLGMQHPRALLANTPLAPAIHLGDADALRQRARIAAFFTAPDPAD
ncbi:MAG: hypothetical protein B7Z83_02610 [Thiomonas sp. 20-64-5]|nr:MAG: hypothetical protein B7Z83_02610 [Thiomonas sp. 20-64-5]